MQLPDIKYENIEQWNAEAQDPRSTQKMMEDSSKKISDFEITRFDFFEETDVAINESRDGSHALSSMRNTENEYTRNLRSSSRDDSRSFNEVIESMNKGTTRDHANTLMKQHGVSQSLLDMIR